jgi:hypothetical protein
MEPQYGSDEVSSVSARTIGLSIAHDVSFPKRLRLIVTEHSAIVESFTIDLR